MPEFFGNSTFFFVAITLGCFALANLCQQRLKQPLLNPILVSAIMIIAVLKMINVPNTAYQVGCHALSFLLTPATICLAISFYEQFQKLKHQQQKHQQKKNLLTNLQTFQERNQKQNQKQNQPQ